MKDVVLIQLASLLVLCNPEFCCHTFRPRR